MKNSALESDQIICSRGELFTCSSGRAEVWKTVSRFFPSFSLVKPHTLFFISCDIECHGGVRWTLFSRCQFSPRQRFPVSLQDLIILRMEISSLMQVNCGIPADGRHASKEKVLSDQGFFCASSNAMTIDFWLSSIVRSQGNAKRRQWIETKPLTRAHFLCLISLVHVYMQILGEHLHKKYAWHGRLGMGLGDEWKAHKKSREFFRIFFSSRGEMGSCELAEKNSLIFRVWRGVGGPHDVDVDKEKRVEFEFVF